jgi:hypothetical protein
MGGAPMGGKLRFVRTARVVLPANGMRDVMARAAATGGWLALWLFVWIGGACGSSNRATGTAGISGAMGGGPAGGGGGGLGSGGADAGSGGASHAGGNGGAPAAGGSGAQVGSGGTAGGGMGGGAVGGAAGRGGGAGEAGAAGGAGGAGQCAPGRVWCPGCTPGTGACYVGGCPGAACPPDGGTGDAATSTCAEVTTLEACDQRTDCHAVFVDQRNCRCASLGCCARFSGCADGDRATCTGQPQCEIATPYCEGPYVVSYTATCYEGCARATECAP